MNWNALKTVKVRTKNHIQIFLRMHLISKEQPKLKQGWICFLLVKISENKNPKNKKPDILVIRFQEPKPPSKQHQSRTADPIDLAYVVTLYSSSFIHS